MKVYTENGNGPALLVSVLALILDSCTQAHLSDTATATALEECAKLDQEEWQRCACCFAWANRGFVYPLIRGETCALVVMCLACVERTTAGTVKPELITEMITNYRAYFEL